MTIILQSYATLKKQTSPEFARQVLLENLKRNNGNVEKTAKEMICSKNTVYLARCPKTGFFKPDLFI
jgi:transcriptional regulator with PAS, ATPase and Fis domain